MKRMFSIVNVLLLFAAVMCSCEREIIMDAEERPVIVVDCVLANTPVQTLKLMLTKGASMSEAPAIEEADAVLFRIRDNREVGRFEWQNDSTWTLEYKALPENSYRLEVRVPGYDLVWAEQTLPERSGVQSIELSDYYGISSYTNFWGSAFSMESTSQLTVINAFFYDSEQDEWQPAEYICTDAPYVDDSNLTCMSYTSPSILVANNNIYPSHMTPTYDPAYLYGNLEGFPLHNGYLLFDTGSVTSYELEHNPISISFYNLSNDGVPEPVLEQEDVRLVAWTLSKDYQKYLNEAEFYKELNESTGLSSIFFRENIYTNIHGGVGFLGAKTGKRLEWKNEYRRYADYIHQE